MKPLTKREKILLYALAVIAIVAGVMVLLIQPEMEKADTLDAAILEKQTAVDSIRTEIVTRQGVQQEIDENIAGIETERAYFLPVMTNNELDEYITGLIQAHGLTALSLAIAATESDEASESDDATADEAATEDTGIYTYAAQVTVRGTMRQFMLLLDTVRELDGIRIATISCTQDVVTTPSPTATPRPNRRSKVTPAPLFAAPAPAAEEGTYTMEIQFYVQEYENGAATSVALDRDE